MEIQMIMKFKHSFRHGKLIINHGNYLINNIDNPTSIIIGIPKTKRNSIILKIP